MHCNITLAQKRIGKSEELRVGVAESTSRSAEVGCREKCRTEKSPHRPLQTIHTRSPQLFQPITVSTVILILVKVTRADECLIFAEGTELSPYIWENWVPDV